MIAPLSSLPALSGLSAARGLTALRMGGVSDGYKVTHPSCSASQTVLISTADDFVVSFGSVWDSRGT